MENHRQIIIIGSGPAGWTAAIYAARAGLKPLVITGMSVGGQMTITGDVENYPGFAHPVSGPALMEDMETQAVACGAEIEYDLIKDVDFSERPFTLIGDGGTWTADAVIVATGATARWLGVEGETQFQGNGVSACATCDGPFFKGQTVAVIGGGNTAAEEAIHLSGLCEKVYLIHRRDELKAEKILCERISRLDNVEFIWNSKLDSIHGEQSVTHVRVASSLGDNEVRELSVNGVFVAIGHDPATTFLNGKINTDSAGYVLVEPGRTRTNVEGVFAAGDVADPHYRQAVTSAAMGCMAALDAERWLRSLC
jgi:thioredoxin reductase (NADPH)